MMSQDTARKLEAIDALLTQGNLRGAAEGALDHRPLSERTLLIRALPNWVGEKQAASVLDESIRIMENRSSSAARGR